MEAVKWLAVFYQLYLLQAFLPSLIQEGYSENTTVIAVQPHVYTQHALNHVGLSPSAYGHWVHGFLMWLLWQFIPNSVWVWWTRRVNIKLRVQGMEKKLKRRAAILNILKHTRDMSFEESSGGNETRQRSHSAFGPPVSSSPSPIMDRRRAHSFQLGNILIGKH